jgi:hypothetical protein
MAGKGTNRVKGVAKSRKKVPTGGPGTSRKSGKATKRKNPKATKRKST